MVASMLRRCKSHVATCKASSVRNGMRGWQAIWIAPARSTTIRLSGKSRSRCSHMKLHRQRKLLRRLEKNVNAQPRFEKDGVFTPFVTGFDLKEITTQRYLWLSLK